MKHVNKDVVDKITTQKQDIGEEIKDDEVISQPYQLTNYLMDKFEPVLKKLSDLD